MANPGPEPDSETSVVERVQSAVREAIVSGAYPAGSRLATPAIAAEHGVSAIPVREALRRLEAERLVILERNRGATVSPMSVADLVDIYSLRELVECHVLRAATPRHDAASLEHVETALIEMLERLRAGDCAGGYERHRAFHASLYEPAASPWTTHVIELLWSGAERYARVEPTLRSSVDEFAAEHYGLLTVVREGDPARAEEALRRHLAHTPNLMVASLSAKMTEVATAAAGELPPHKRAAGRHKRSSAVPRKKVD